MEGRFKLCPVPAKRRDRIHTFAPQNSVIGMLLCHEEEYTVIHSVQNGLLQHDPYTWEVKGKSFICLDTVTDESRFIDMTLKRWIGDMDEEQRPGKRAGISAGKSRTARTEASKDP